MSFIRSHISRVSRPSFWKPLLHLLPVVPLLALLVAVLVRDVRHEPPPPPVTVVVRSEPRQKAPGTYASAAVFKAVVKDEAPGFDSSIVMPPPVRVTIIDEKEERPPVKLMPVRVKIEDDSNDSAFVDPKSSAAAIDSKPRVIWQYGPGMRFGITAAETKKRLTFAGDGSTNQTLLRVNGEQGEFGGPLGRFVERDTKLPANAALKAFGGSKTVWISGKIIYTQILELMPSKQPVLVGGEPRLLLDTVRVRYIIENKDKAIYRVGLRTQVDTLIGGNDGVPFTVPGLPGLVVGFADFPKLAPIPDFIQALERPHLHNPGTVAQMSLKLGSGIEPPTRVSLTHWPGANFANWEVPLVPIAGDSAVVLYWIDKPLRPGERRELGFAYGLGSIASTDPGGLGVLGVTLGGSFEPGEAFTVTAYVQDAKRGQTLTLEVPEGLERIEGNQLQPVPPPTLGAASSIVTWKVRVLKTGTFPLKVVSSNGLAQTKTISIERPEGAPELRLALDLSGSFEPGQEFTARATVTSSGTESAPDPVLTLPPGLSRSEGPLVTPQPAAGNKGTVHIAVWKIKVLEPGTYAVRVAWRGAAMTKSLSIVRPDTPVGGYVNLALAPPFAPGQAFTVEATVSEPIPGQTLTLQLPPGLHIVAGDETVPVVQANDGAAAVRWQVMVNEPGTFPVRLVSSTGLTLKKTVVIEAHQEKGGDFKLEHAGEIAPGKEFTVRATVTKPALGQKLTLLPLPAGLELVQGPAAKDVPPETGDTADTIELTWRLRVLDKGTLPVRVASTTGVVQSFTITITLEQPPGSDPQLFGGRR